MKYINQLYSNGMLMRLIYYSSVSTEAESKWLEAKVEAVQFIVFHKEISKEGHRKSIY